MVNPFTHAVEFVRFALYGQLNPGAAAVTFFVLGLFGALAVWAYDPARGMISRRSGGA